MSNRFIRQRFLGPSSKRILGRVHVGVVGLGGGGSHVVQQLAHIGVQNFTLVDPDRIEESNLNRLVGATADDVRSRRRKTQIAERAIRRLNKNAQVVQRAMRWQLAADTLKPCDLVFGGLDRFGDRLELEAFCRRLLVPYIDLGMDVHKLERGFGVYGQVMASLPDRPCLKCLGVIQEAWRSREAARYGEAGSAPQVVWPNGLLASVAVGIFVQLLCPWHAKPVPLLVEYDGNNQTLQQSTMLEYLTTKVCPHFEHYDNVGDVWFSA